MVFYGMNGGKAVNGDNSTTAQAEKLPNQKKLAMEWNIFDWKKAENEINRLQARIAKAVAENKWNTVKRLQYLITHSYYAKALAVKTVTMNKGKNTPGIDGEIWQSASDKMKAVLSLSDKRYRSKPLRRIYIDKKDKKTKRPLSIPTMYDRAMQALYAMALQPVAETTADRNSYGFRKYRSCHDACEHIFVALSRKYSPQWILEGDIRGCFDHINHKWLIDNIPLDKSVLKQFLKAGYVYQGKMFPTEEGTPQGGIISPILANMTLDGIQETLAKKFDTNPRGKYTQKTHNKNKVNFIRYADDFIVTAENKETANEVKETIKQFLKCRGLELSEEKTLITNIKDGFDMLGWTFRKFNQKLIIKPSKKSIKNLTSSISDLIRKGCSFPQELLIIKANQKIIGWGNYHRTVCAKKTFQKIDGIIFILLWKWACRRHRQKGRQWIKQKYWTREEFNHWVFSDKGRKLKRLSYIPITRHPKLNLSQNPYLNTQYFLTRQKSLKSKKLLEPQCF